MASTTGFLPTRNPEEPKRSCPWRLTSSGPWSNPARYPRVIDNRLSFTNWGDPVGSADRNRPIGKGVPTPGSVWPVPLIRAVSCLFFMNDWIDDELKTLDLGDDRLHPRQKILLDRFAAQPAASIPGACRGWAETKAAYRFFAHPRVTAEEVL